MENPISSTLFRFVSFRSPELPKETSKTTKFIFQPAAIKNGVFYDAIATMPANSSKKAALTVAASKFTTAFTSEDDVKRISEPLYDFGSWVARNRTSFTEGDLQYELSKVSGSLDDENLKVLWNNLFYQIITQKSFYLKEALMQTLLANHVVALIGGRQEKAIEPVATSDKEILNSSIALPVELFDDYSKIPQEEKPDEDSDELIPVLPDMALSKQVASVEASFKINKYSQLKNELELSEKKFVKEYKDGYDTAYKAYEAEIAPELKRYAEELDAAKRAFCAIKDPGIPYDPNDPCEQMPSVPFPSLPDFSFDFTAPVTRDRMEADLSYDSYNTLLGILGYDFENDEPVQAAKTALAGVQDVFSKIDGYQDVFSKLEIADKDARLQLTGNIPLFKSKVSIGGVTVPVNITPSLAPYSFTLCGSIVNLSSVFTLTMGLPNTNVGILSIKVTAKFPDNTTIVKNITSPKTTKSGSTITASGFYTYTFPNGSRSNPPKLDFEILFTNGCKKTIAAVNAILELCVRGTAGGSCPDPNAPGTISTGFIPSGFGFKELGVADYRKIEQTVQCYVEGEVSNIENIMAREYREKSTRMLRRSEQTTTTSSEQENERLSDTTIANRFEMQSEISSVISEMKDQAGFVNVGYSNSGFSINTGLSFANNKSKEDSIRQAQTQSQEITERALDRVVSKIKEERITKILEEFEENNKHGYDNRQGTEHVVGVYRWVDKLYKNQIYNYGKRMMFEFMVPEPSKLHLLGLTESSEDSGSDTVNLTPPVDPRTYEDGEYRMMDFRWVNSERAAMWAAVYNAEIEPIPLYRISVGESFSIKLEGGSKLAEVEANSGNGKITIPEGYRAEQATGVFNAVSDNKGGQGRILSLTVGNKTATYTSAFPSKSLPLNTLSSTPPEVTNSFTFGPDYTGEIPVSYTLGNHVAGDISVTVTCVTTDEFVQAWKQRTFKAIIDGYEEALAAYNEKVKEEQNKAVTIKATNPGFYRQIENIVLRKNCISYLLDQNPSAPFTYGKKMYNDQSTFEGYEVTVNNQLSQYASFVKFMEQAFEWEIMSYNFYPYYWGNRNDWKDLYNYNESDDPIFRSFMQSGMARVIVTVRPGFEEAVALYMSTGILWNGGEMPVIGNPLYISIVDEVKQAKSVPEGKPWITRVPTTLTILQAGSIGLQVDKALPCDCTGKEDFENPELIPCDSNFDLNGNQLGNGSDVPNVQKIQFTFQQLDHYLAYSYTVGFFDEESLWPRIYECMGQEIIIDRDASWNSEDSMSVVYDILANQLSMITGVHAERIDNVFDNVIGDIRPDSIKFTVDTTVITDFRFIKKNNFGQYEPKYDELRVVRTGNSVRVFADNVYVSYRVLDRHNGPVLHTQQGTLLPISRFSYE